MSSNVDILIEIKKIREDLDYLKKVLSASEIGDYFLTSEEEKMIKEVKSINNNQDF
jgi:type IV secretory pathway ATPase VirB11/archaellum biosynthesis ATPase